MLYEGRSVSASVPVPRWVPKAARARAAGEDRAGKTAAWGEKGKVKCNCLNLGQLSSP